MQSYSHMPSPETFGDYLRSLREARGLSRKRLAFALKDTWGDDTPTASAIGTWEREQHTGMSAAWLAQVAVLLEADMAKLFWLLAIARTGDPALAADLRRRLAEVEAGSDESRHGQPGTRPTSASRRAKAGRPRRGAGR